MPNHEPHLIAVHVDALNEFLGDDVPQPLRFGIGIHGGDVIIGDIGSEEHTVFTALGDPVTLQIQLRAALKRGELRVDQLDALAMFLTQYVGYPRGSQLFRIVTELKGKPITDGRAAPM